MAIDSNLGVVIGRAEGAVESIPGNEGLTRPGKGQCARRYACFLCKFLALGRWDPEERSFTGSSGEAGEDNKAPMFDCLRCKDGSKRLRQNLWFQSKLVCIKARAEDISTCRSRGPKGELVEKDVRSCHCKAQSPGKDHEHGGEVSESTTLRSSITERDVDICSVLSAVRRKRPRWLHPRFFSSSCSTRVSR